MSSEYDRNTWKGTRIVPDAQQRMGLARGELFVPKHDKVQFLSDFAASNVEWVELDSVGGTFLYVKSIVHKEGAAFPIHYAVGAEWQHEGYDAIESEGLCYVAKFLGYSCWGLATEYTVHSSA